METKQKYLRDIRDAINGVETAMPGVAGESEATYLRDIAKAIRSSGIDPSIPKVTDADNGKILKVVNGVWAKADDEGVLYGEETPASTLGKDGDVYVQYETRSEEEALIENQQILDTDYITDILAEDYEILKFYVHQYVRSTKTEYDHYMVNVAMSYLMEYKHVKILDSDDHVIANITITNDGYIKMINNSSIQEYYLVFSIYEPVVKPNSITDIYLKVNGEWVKDGFGKDKEPEQPESISLLHFDEDFVNDQITDAKGNTYSIMTGTTGVSMTNETKRFGEKCLSMNGQGWVNSEILGDKLDFKNGDFTIDLWVRPSDTWRMCPICLPGNGLLIDLEGGKARIWFVDENGRLVVHADGGGNGFGTIPVPPNVWTHIAYVREGNYVALFVNGKLDIYVYIGSINKQYIPGSSGIRLGNWDNGDSALYTYAGYIDEVRVTNKAMWHIFDNCPTEPYTK